MQSKSVGQIVTEIRDLLEGEFRSELVVGEITNLSYSSSGHWYFNLSDKSAGLRCALFKMDAFRNPQIKNLKDGDKVICSGKIGVYIKRGEFQLIVKRVTPVGKGDLKAQFEELKRRLASEGLFDPMEKKKIPEFPKRIGVITAEGAAALQDFLNIFERRSLWMDLVLSPALVQGDAAPASIVKALHKLIKYSNNAPDDKKLDLIVLTRGGGSLEDLWAFNDEGLAYEIFNCPIPTISAIGHQVDFSISDFVADLRCETPSAAAEIITESQVGLLDRMEGSLKHLHSFGKIMVGDLKHRIESSNPRSMLDSILNQLYRYRERLGKLNVTERSDGLLRLNDRYLELDDHIDNMIRLLGSNIEKHELSLKRIDGMLRVLNPKNVLERGYSYVQGEDGFVIASSENFKALPSNTELTLHFHDGKGKVKKS